MNSHSPTAASAEAGHRSTASMGTLMLGAVGVVYGDIGTSPLYTLKEVFSGHLAATEANVFGILSLVFWSLMVVVTAKFVLVIMRADNRGEGGVLALSTLAQRGLNPRATAFVGCLGMLGMALFVGDSLITPAISVLSAMEGIDVASPGLTSWILPATLVILGSLFAIQFKGTEVIGKLFGPIMLAWFVVLGLLGAAQIARHPAVLEALWPGYALGFFRNHGIGSFFVLGSVVLAVTGGEALYADMGHFGRIAISRAWTCFVLPCLVLNYFGQGALLVTDPDAAANPFYLLAPDWALWPMLLLATCATVIASQAVISGAFSVTQQAIQLGYLPRREIRHTSSHAIGQVYIPRTNWMLLIGVVILVLGFRSSGALASAYGISVVGTMTIDAVLAFVVARNLWRWPLAYAAPLFAVFIGVDLVFLAANLPKVLDGGWLPVLIAAVAFTMMYIWRKGRRVVLAAIYHDGMPVESFIKGQLGRFQQRPPGTAVYMTGNTEVIPPTLLHTLKHFGVLHERVVLLTVQIGDVPYRRIENRVVVTEVGQGFFQVQVNYGYMEKPHLLDALPQLAAAGLDLDMMRTSFFLGRETLLPGNNRKRLIGPLCFLDPTGLNTLEEPVYMAMARTSTSATEFFGLPPGRVVELGSQVRI